MDLIHSNMQRRKWIDWYSKKKNLLDLFAQEQKRNFLGPFDWEERFKATQYGFFVPQLVGDVMYLHKLADDGFGNLVKVSASDRESRLFFV